MRRCSAGDMFGSLTFQATTSRTDALISLVSNLDKKLFTRTERTSPKILPIAPPGISPPP